MSSPGPVTDGPGPSADGPGPAADRWLVLAVALTSTCLVVGGVSIANLAIPSMQRGLHTGFAEVMLAVAGYGLSYTVFLTTGGRLGDLLGRKPVLLAGLALFTLAVTACGLAPDAPVLIAARLLQGVGAALVYPQVLSVIEDTFTGRERTTALGAFGAAIGVAIVAGQLLGGAVIQWDLAGLGWRPAFLLLAPVGLAALGTGALVLRGGPRPGPVRIDWGGIGAIAGGLLLLVAPLLLGPDTGWPWWTWAMLAAAPLLFARLVACELRQVRLGRVPLLRPELFRQRSFTLGMVIGTVYFVTVVGFTVYTTLTLQLGGGLTPLHAGLAFTPVGVAFFAASLLGPRLALLRGRGALSLGCALLAAGLAADLAVVRSAGTGLSPWQLAGPLVLVGAGQGFAMSPLIGTVLAGVRPEDRGSASGALSTAFQLGQTLGLAGFGTLFAALGARPGVARAAERYHSAYAASLLLLVVLALAVVALVQRLPQPGPPERHRHFPWARHGTRTGLAHAHFHLTGGHAVGWLTHWIHEHEPHADRARPRPPLAAATERN
ncbi:MFS transporter [Kitasatospora sp. NPDC088391]|uniref:MFS transporter n=1 Tax=Kitasatospora sp. NPDC088391 TaxID=3364074 RepID=UPI0038107031